MVFDSDTKLALRKSPKSINFNCVTPGLTPWNEKYICIDNDIDMCVYIKFILILKIIHFPPKITPLKYTVPVLWHTLQLINYILLFMTTSSLGLFSTQNIKNMHRHRQYFGMISDPTYEFH